MNRCCTPPPIGETSPPARFATVRHRLFSDDENSVSVARQLGMDDDRSSTCSRSRSYPLQDIPSREDTCPFFPSQTQTNECVPAYCVATPPRLRDDSLPQLFIDVSCDPASADGRAAALGFLNVPNCTWKTEPAPLSFAPPPLASDANGVPHALRDGHATPVPCQTPQPHRLFDTAAAFQGPTPSCQCGPSVASLLFTPQLAPAVIAMRRQLDAELDDTNVMYRAVPLPPVTSLIENQLFMGGYPDDVTLAILRQLGVRHVVNCCAADYRSNPALAPEFRVYDIDAFDSPDYFILHHDYDSFSQLLSSLLAAGERVFVHCIAGVNRSVTLCAAFLIEHCGMTPIQVVKLFRARQRMRILENVSFRHQIIDHYLQCSAHRHNEEEF